MCPSPMSDVEFRIPPPPVHPLGLGATLRPIPKHTAPGRGIARVGSLYARSKDFY